MEMTLPQPLSVESTKKYSSINTKKQTSLYRPQRVMLSGGSVPPLCTSVFLLKDSTMDGLGHSAKKGGREVKS
jgi:hypothetical protein